MVLGAHGMLSFRAPRVFVPLPAQCGKRWSMDPFWGQFGPIFKSYVGFRDGVIMKNTTPLCFLLKKMRNLSISDHQQNEKKIHDSQGHQGSGQQTRTMQFQLLFRIGLKGKRVIPWIGEEGAKPWIRKVPLLVGTWINWTFKKHTDDWHTKKKTKAWKIYKPSVLRLHLGGVY